MSDLESIERLHAILESTIANENGDELGVLLRVEYTDGTAHAVGNANTARATVTLNIPHVNSMFIPAGPSDDDPSQLTKCPHCGRDIP